MNSTSKSPSASISTTALLAFNQALFRPIFLYALGPCALLSLVSNTLVLVGMWRLGRSDKRGRNRNSVGGGKGGVSSSVRFYYLVIAVFQLLNTVMRTFLTSFLEAAFDSWFKLPYFLYILPTITTFYYCKVLGLIWWGAENAANYALLCLTIECTIAVLVPFRARNLLNFRFSVAFFIILLFLSSAPWLWTVPIMSGWGFDPIMSYSGEWCQAIIQGPLLIFGFATAIFCFSVIQTIGCFLCVVLIVWKIFQANRNRYHLSSALVQDQPGGISSKELITSATAMLLACVNLALFLPIICFYTVTFYSPPDTPLSTKILLGAATRVNNEAFVLGHCLNFWIYVWRVRAFRDELRLMFRCSFTRDDQSSLKRNSIRGA